jgi:glucans biosynthesis protein C
LSTGCYALRPVRREHLPDFYSKKLRRLGIPLLILAPIFFVLQAITPGTTATPDWYEFLTIPVLPYQHFWYLQALLLIFLAVGFLDAMGWLFRPAVFAGLSAASTRRRIRRPHWALARRVSPARNS